MTYSTIGFVTLAAAIMAPVVDAHMIMAQPIPYGVDTLNNSPLSGDYPCKQRAGVYDISKMNFMEVGKPQPLSFKGTAVHGGGSCQVSVSLDKQPTASSVFKVIHSIEGNCPGVDGGPGTFDFQLPQGFPNGEFALAWTWFNKIGNREMYMNCAPITVTGGAGNNDVYNKLPDMQVANIPPSTCKTVDSTVPLFPNPGGSLQKLGDGPFQDMQGDCGGTPSKNQPDMGAGGSDGSSSQQQQQQPHAVPSSAPPSPSPSSPSTTAPAASPTEQPPTSATSAPAPAKSSASSGSGSGCGADGTMVCNGPKQFGICSFGKAVWQDVAPGTKCEGGKITFASGNGARSVGRGIAGRISYNVTLE